MARAAIGVAAMYYHPCSVYLREGGQAIGTIDEPMAVQCRKIAHFVANANCLSDPICRKYCLHCTKNFNLPRASTAIYAKTVEDERLQVALSFEAVWRAVSLSQAGERWVSRTPGIIRT